jgi:hypothetical protein
MTTMDTTTCPDCAAPAEVTDRSVLESTDGPIEHVKIRCVGGHWFLLSVASLRRPVELERTAGIGISRSRRA